MSDVIKAKLFTHGGSQAVRLPKAFRFEGVEVRIRRDGERVILEPILEPAERDWAAFWARIDAHKVAGSDDDWPGMEEPVPGRPVDLDSGPDDEA